jgi:hypothetical protein
MIIADKEFEERSRLAEEASRLLCRVYCYMGRHDPEFADSDDGIRELRYALGSFVAREERT